MKPLTRVAFNYGLDISANQGLKISDGAPPITTNQLYRVGADLYWNGNALGFVSFVPWGNISGTLSNQTDLQTEFDKKSPIASPAFTGVPTAPTATTGVATTQIATTAFVDNRIIPIDHISALGTPGSTTYLRGDGNWATAITAVSGTSPVVSSGGLTPAISMAAATDSIPGYMTAADHTSLTGKAPSANPTFTGTVIAPIIDSASAGTLSLGATNASTVNLGTASTTQTINIGTGSGTTTINLGGAGDTVAVAGTLTSINTTNTNITDKLITLNKGGVTASGDAVGIEVEENNIITGYAKVGNSRNSWIFSAPAKSGSMILTPSASAFSSEFISSATANRTITFPDSTGTVALLSDITYDNTTGSISAQTITYNSNGSVNVITETVDGSTRTITLAYNSDGTVLTVTTVLSGVTRTETYAYTNGLLSGMTAVEV